MAIVFLISQVRTGYLCCLGNMGPAISAILELGQSGLSALASMSGPVIGIARQLCRFSEPHGDRDGGAGLAQLGGEVRGAGGRRCRGYPSRSPLRAAPSTSARKMCFWILPDPVRGSSNTIRNSFGIL